MFRIATYKAHKSDTAALIEIGDRKFEVSHAELSTYDTEAKIEARLKGLAAVAGVALPTFHIHINRDGSLAMAIGKKPPPLWPEDLPDVGSVRP